MIWRTVSRLVDEAIPLDHPRRYASRVIRWYDPIHSTWYCTPDQVTIMIMCMPPWRKWFAQGSEIVMHSGDSYYLFCLVQPISFWIHVIGVYPACATANDAVLGTYSVSTGYFSDMISQDVLMSNSENTAGTVLWLSICLRYCSQWNSDSFIHNEVLHILDMAHILCFCILVLPLDLWSMSADSHSLVMTVLSRYLSDCQSCH